MELAKKLGFTAVEFWEGQDFDITAYKQGLEGLTLACMGYATDFIDPNARTKTLDDFAKSLSNAKELGAKGIIIAAGQTLPDLSHKAQHESLITGLKEAAKLVKGTGINILLEPLNTLVDHVGYFLDSSLKAFDIIRDVGSPNVKVLFDIYHQQVSEGNLIANITNNIDLIGHFHIAGNPGRGEPYLGEINYPQVLKAIAEAGYDRYVGLEYWPKGDVVESLEKCLELYS